MKKLALLTILLSTTAYAEDGQQPPAEQPAAATAPTPPPAAQPAPAVTPAPTEWYLKVDQQGINVLSQCIQELPKKVADPFLFNLDGQLKGQAALIAAIKAK